MARKTINLALQGGGSHGAVTWGVVDRLLEDDRLEIGAVSGASAGAVNAVALAYGLHKNGAEGGKEALEALWRKVSDKGSIYSPVRATGMSSGGQMDFLNSVSYQFFETITRTWSPYQFNPAGLNPLRDILSELIDFDSLSSCKVTQLFIAATNVRSGKVHVFDTKDVSIDVICASACLPHLFQAVEIDGEHYWDGGYMGNPVLYPFFYEASSADIVIVHVNPIEREGVPQTAPDIMNRVNEISFNSSLMRELRAISFVHKLIDDGWLKDEYVDHLRNIFIHSIRSDQALTDLSVASKFRTDWPFLQSLKDKGREIAEDWLTAHFDDIGERSSVDLRAMFDTQ